MSVYLMGLSTLTSLFKLIALLIVFILILVASYYVTKWYAKSGMLGQQARNIQVIENFPMGPGKQICILKMGGKYIAVSVCKDNITFLTELDGEEISEEQIQGENTNFKEIFGKMMGDKGISNTFKKKDKK